MCIIRACSALDGLTCSSGNTVWDKQSVHVQETCLTFGKAMVKAMRDSRLFSYELPRWWWGQKY